MTLDTLLRSLPAGFGIVEYLQVAIWPAQTLAVAERRGQVQLHPLQVPAPPARQDPVQDKQASLAVSAPASQTATPAAASTEQSSSTSAAIPTPAALVAYADSDTDDEA